MIKIEINAENGTDARKELMDLLGLSAQPVVTTVKASDIVIVADKSAEKIADGQTSFTEQTQEQPASEAEGKTRKRRTKAEIEAEQAALTANTGSEEPPASETNVEPPTAEEPKAEIPDASKVKEICAILVRAGKKDDAIKIIESFGVKTSPEIPEDKRAEFIAKAKAFADENNIAY